MFNQVEVIFRAIEFIECHLEDEINVSQVAEEIHFSLFHFLRTFNRITHHTPYDYIIRRRLSEAARRMITTNARIIDIAQDYCFNNQESFARAFKRMFGIQPSQWRNGQTQPAGRLMEPVTLDDLNFRNRLNFTIPVMEERKAVHLTGLMTSIDLNDANWPDKRNQLVQDFMKIDNCRKPRNLYLVNSFLDRLFTKGYVFVGSCEENSCCTNDILVSRGIPGGFYIRMTSTISERKMALNYLFNTWLPANRMILSENLEIELQKTSETKSEQGHFDILVPVQNVL